MSPEPPNVPSPQPETHARVRRRARKRDGPPQLQFLTATDPSQFKDENAKRSVRSQAMIQYRYKADQQKRQGKETLSLHGQSDAKATGHRNGAPLVGAVDKVPGADGLDEAFDDPHLYSANANESPHSQAGQSFGYPPWHSPSQTVTRPQSRYHRALSQLPLNAAAQQVVDYEQNNRHEEAQMAIILGQLSRINIGDSADPFAALPQFSSHELSSLELVRQSNRVFVTQSTLERWVPTMLAHPHILLSATTLTSGWLDMQEGRVDDSRRTMLIKGETIGWINMRLRRPASQFEDPTLIVILHLLAGEMWQSNEKALRVHESGVARLITHRGGMERVGANPVVAEVAAAVCYHTDIICEVEPLPLFRDWQPSEFAPISEDMAIPESPVFGPRSELFTLVRDPRCSPLTYQLLCDMRDLTSLFIHHNQRVREESDSPPSDLHLSPRRSSGASDYQNSIAEIGHRLASLPSAYTPDVVVTGDWLYECCRLASIIYATAIMMRVPFSVAAEPGRSVIISDIAAQRDPSSGDPIFSTKRLTEVLFETLDKSNMDSIWGNMSGVLYWVCLVGAAAGRTPSSISMSPLLKSPRECRARWVRRCLAMYATRPLIILMFQHPLVVVCSQKRLLMVQELLRPGP